MIEKIKIITDVNLRLLKDEIESDVQIGSKLLELNSWNNGNNELRLHFDDTFNASDNTVLDGIISAHDDQPLWLYKQLKEEDIDRRTGELISEGYEFPPASGKIFSLSQSAQINILALDNTRTELTYPVNYNTKDNLDTYAIPDATTLHNMYLTALSVKKAHLDSGTALKDLVRAATDKAGVDAVVDNR